MIATITGRLQTKVTLFTVLFAFAAAFQPVLGMDVWALAAIAACVGILLELLWGIFVTYQPGWLSFIMAGIEFGIITAVATSLQISLSLGEAASFYVCVWSITQLLLLYVLPVLAPQWPERSLRLW